MIKFSEVVYIMLFLSKKKGGYSPPFLLLLNFRWVAMAVLPIEGFPIYFPGWQALG